MGYRRDIDAGAKKVCQLVGGLTIPEPWDLKSFIDGVASKRGKPIGPYAVSRPVWIRTTVWDLDRAHHRRHNRLRRHDVELPRRTHRLA